MKLVEAVKTLEEEQAKLREKESELFDSCLTQLFKDVPGLKSFELIGYTPGFNDGDPCSHSHYVLVSIDDYYDHGREEYLYDILSEKYDEEVIEALPRDKYDCYDYTKLPGIEEMFPSGEIASSVHKMFDDVFYEEIQRRWYTDFQVTFTRDDSDPKGYTTVKEYYDCGY